MKTISLLLLLAATLLVNPAASFANGYSRGVNMAGPDFGDKRPGVAGHDFTFNSAPSFEYFGKKGLTLFRISISWERIQPALDGPLDHTYLDGLKQDVAWAKQYGDKVIIDIHNYARYSVDEGGARHSYIIDNVYDGKVKVTTANLADLWVKLSDEFKSESTVIGYGLMNEPHDLGTANWHNISQDVLTAIRKHGDKKLIYVPSDSWTGASSWVRVNGPKSWIVDPAKNFKYEAHEYFDHDHSGTYGWTYEQELAKNPNMPMAGAKRVKEFADWCKTNGVRGYLGEFGAPNSDPRWNAVLDNFLTACDAAGFDATIWAAGEWWGGYPLSVQPTDNFKTDAAQMPILLKHLGK